MQSDPYWGAKNTPEQFLGRNAPGRFHWKLTWLQPCEIWRPQPCEISHGWWQPCEIWRPQPWRSQQRKLAVMEGGEWLLTAEGGDARNHQNDTLSYQNEVSFWYFLA